MSSRTFRRRARIVLVVAALAAGITELSAHVQAAPAKPKPRAHVRVVSNTYYPTAFSALRVLGVVKNMTGTAQENVHIFASFKDSAGKTIGGAAGAPLIAELGPHATAPFDLTAQSAPAGISSITFKVTSDPVGQLVKVLTQQISNLGPGQVRLVVSIRDMSHSRIDAENLVGVAYDKDGQVVDVARSGCCPFSETLDPGAVGSLSLTFDHAQGATRFALYTNNIAAAN
jgi:hypothetical protein